MVKSWVYTAAGAAVMPRECGERSPCLEADSLQRFMLRNEGRIELADFGLCMTVSNESDATFDKTHRWRTLFMAHCDEVDLFVRGFKPFSAICFGLQLNNRKNPTRIKHVFALNG